MTLTRPLTQTTTAPPTFADAAERHLDDVFGYLLYLTRDRPLADDLAGATFEKAFRAVVAVRPTPRQRPNLAARDRPHDRARLVPGRVPAPPSRGGARARGPGGRVRRGPLPELQLALATLSAGEREVLVLRIVIELDGDQTARVLGISPTAVSTRLSRALQKLEEKVRNDDLR